ncbi:MAG: acetylneuraminic acid synthetase [Firmicutes bacterium]|nr:acetylneuraminic acid synthetase [Bacillota bacterium]
MREIVIGKKRITRDDFQKPYIIAEAGVNHEGSIEIACRMVREAAEAGADAIKFQMYAAQALASKNSPAYWDRTMEPTGSQYELFKKYEGFGGLEFERLASEAESAGIDLLVTPFDKKSADILEPFVPAYKVASADITNIPLIEHIANKGKPILLATGASSIEEIYRAVSVIHALGNSQVALLHCILNYPTAYENAHLGMIIGMSRAFPDLVIGYSDHTLPERMDDVLLVAWLLGARIIEKHFTYDKSLRGNDHYHAMDKDDLARFIRKLDFVTKIIGSCEKHYLPSEEVSRRNARRSLVALREIARGQTITAEDITCKRPGTGIPPTMIDYVIGGVALDDIHEDEIFAFSKVRLRDC